MIFHALALQVALCTSAVPTSPCWFEVDDVQVIDADRWRVSVFGEWHEVKSIWADAEETRQRGRSRLLAESRTAVRDWIEAARAGGRTIFLSVILDEHGPGLDPRGRWVGDLYFVGEWLSTRLIESGNAIYCTTHGRAHNEANLMFSERRMMLLRRGVWERGLPRAQPWCRRSIEHMSNP